MELESSMTKMVSNVARKAYGSSGVARLDAEMTEGDGEGARTAGASDEYGGGASVARYRKTVSPGRGGGGEQVNLRAGRRVGVVPLVVVRGGEGACAVFLKGLLEDGFELSMGEEVLRDSLSLTEAKNDLVGMPEVFVDVSEVL